MMARRHIADAHPPPIVAVSVARTDVGMVRASNEDSFLVRDDIGLWVVADGMGGHQGGALASSLVVGALADLPEFTSGFGLLKAVRETLAGVNAQLTRKAASFGSGGVIGSTVAALLISEEHFACVWAGDSRIYRLRGGALDRLTRDHSVIQEMIDRGDLTPTEAAVDRRSNMITRAVGAGRELELEIAHGSVEAGDRFLLCSDGLTGAVPDSELVALMSFRVVEDAADALLDRALEQGATDNVTLVLVQWGQAAARTPTS
jgi:serine/threonine protein phosphatase PrpC